MIVAISWLRSEQSGARSPRRVRNGINFWILAISRSANSCPKIGPGVGVGVNVGVGVGIGVAVGVGGSVGVGKEVGVGAGVGSLVGVGGTPVTVKVASFNALAEWLPSLPR